MAITEESRGCTPTYVVYLKERTYIAYGWPNVKNAISGISGAGCQRLDDKKDSSKALEIVEKYGTAEQILKFKNDMRSSK